MNHWLIAPPALTAVVARLFKTYRGEAAGAVRVGGPSAAFAEIVDADPEELPRNIREFFYPLLGCISRAVLAAEKRFGREAAVILLVQMLLVIIAHNIKMVNIA